MTGILRYMNRQDGVYSVVALMLIAWVCVPLALVLIDTGRGGGAASQATGMSYNLAYTSASRAVDAPATAQVGVAQLSYKNGAVQGETQKVLNYQAALASLSSGGLTKFALQAPNPNLVQAPGGSGPAQLSLVNVAVNNYTASVANNGGPNAPNRPCGGPAPISGGNVYRFDVNGNSQIVCWVDQRIDGATKAGTYEHFSTGSQVRVTFSTPSIFGRMFNPQDPSIDGVRTGVAVLGRPCSETATSRDCRL